VWLIYKNVDYRTYGTIEGNFRGCSYSIGMVETSSVRPLGNQANVYAPTVTLFTEETWFQGSSALIERDTTPLNSTIVSIVTTGEMAVTFYLGANYTGTNYCLPSSVLKYDFFPNFTSATGVPSTAKWMSIKFTETCPQKSSILSKN
jgi:hypothetical protein